MFPDCIVMPQVLMRCSWRGVFRFVYAALLEALFATYCIKAVWYIFLTLQPISSRRALFFLQFCCSRPPSRIRTIQSCWINCNIASQLGFLWQSFSVRVNWPVAWSSYVSFHLVLSVRWPTTRWWMRCAKSWPADDVLPNNFAVLLLYVCVCTELCLLSIVLLPLSSLSILFPRSSYAWIHILDSSCDFSITIR